MSTKTLSENITQAISDFNSIKNAIIAKGVEVPSGTHTSDYATKIGQIESGGGGGDLPSTCVLMKSSNNNGVLDTIVIKGLTSIPDYYFYTKTNTSYVHFSQIKYIEFDNNLLSIGKYAFYDISSLLTVNIPNSVETIDNYSFATDSYSNNTYININSGSSLKTIGDYAFTYRKINNLYLGNNFKSIGQYAFNATINNITIADDCRIKSIGTGAFGTNCTSITASNITDIINHWYPESESDVSVIFEYIVPNTVCNDLKLKFIYDKFFLVTNNSNITKLTIENTFNDIIDDNSVAPFGKTPIYGLINVQTLKLPAVKNDHSTLTDTSINYRTTTHFLYERKFGGVESSITDLILGDYDSTDKNDKWAASVYLGALNNLTTESAINILNNLAELEEGVTKTITFNSTVLTNVNNAVGGTEAISKAQNNGWTITS